MNSVLKVCVGLLAVLVLVPAVFAQVSNVPVVGEYHGAAGLYDTYFRGISVRGSYAYIVGGEDTDEDTFRGLFVLDVSNPTSIDETGRVSTGVPRDVVVQGNYAYVVTDFNGFLSINISNPANPVQADIFNGEEFGPYSVEALDTVAVTLSWFYNTPYVDTWNIRNPQDLKLYSEQWLGSWPFDLCTFSAAAYHGMDYIGIAANSCDFYTMSITGGWMGSCEIPDGDAWGVAFKGNYAYVASGSSGGSRIINTSDPYAPVDVTRVGALPAAERALVSGNFLFLSGAPGNRVLIFDISTPTAPVPVGRTNSIVVENMDVSGNFLYVIEQWGSLYVYDCTAIISCSGTSRGSVQLIKSGPPNWGYRLVESQGCIDQLTFTNFCPGTTGYVTGAAAANWSVLANGDGNNGDSIIFVANFPLTSGSTDTFWLSNSNCGIAQINWSVGDTSGIIDGPLPVELASFDAVSSSGGIRLSFSTASELNNDHFEIMRSTFEFGEYTRITSLPSQGNSATEHRYAYLDRDVADGQTYWYFLADVDQNGNRTEHRDLLRSALARGASVLPKEYYLSAYPNPFNPSTTISFSIIESGNVRLDVYDVSGRWIRTLTNENREAGSYSVTFNANDLPSGIYFVRMNAYAFRTTHKIVLMK
ncbi:T9SS C-terminal target domain-containing protein [candidate division KSB1 bacterium]|nr:MAG: T9SS C-terminal target domain-containing protein [candidate division KSB1 bacterium]